MALAGEVGIKVITFEDVLAAGRENKAWEMANVTEDDFCTFSYTSGTTGDPKGVKLSHKMLVNMISSVNTRLANVNSTLTERDTHVISTSCSFFRTSSLCHHHYLWCQMWFLWWRSNLDAQTGPPYFATDLLPNRTKNFQQTLRYHAGQNQGNDWMQRMVSQ